MSFLDIVSKFNQQADSHSKSQSLNPFSEQFEQSRSPSPRFSREEYGKPIAGSKTDLRGRKAKSHICREILELCTVIHDVGTYNSKKRVSDDDDDEHCIDDGTIIVSFGELFQIYTKISDKVVGLLIAAKRRGFVYFDREILFQRRDDDVLIALLKPISEISKILKEDISQANSSAPVESKPIEKKKSSSSSKTKRVETECNKEKNEMSTKHMTIGDQPNVTSEVTNDSNALTVEVEINDEHKTNCDELINVANVGNNDNHDTNCNEQVDNKFAEEGLVNNVIEISENIENQYIQVDDNMSEVVNSLVIDDGTKTKETDGFDVVIENKSEVCDLASDDNSGEVRVEVENVQSETRVEINKTQTNNSEVDVTEESMNDVVDGSENIINNETEHTCL
uniref:Actin-binding Rho-activating protein n=3 Tax=Melanaphis sacchari TaxID=742174 RepID=A0A2H8TMZ5_9HEMI